MPHSRRKGLRKNNTAIGPKIGKSHTKPCWKTLENILISDKYMEKNTNI
jgi:hypothetical protein